MFKTQLQQLCQKQKWRLPEYSAMNEGLQHKPSFKASVVVNGVTFTSDDTFNSSKEAHNQAAMKAIFSFSSPSYDQNGSKEKVEAEMVEAAKPQESSVPAKPPLVIATETNRVSKNQLQHYARKNNLDQPVFTTKSEGLAHEIYYKATVVIDGKSFESPAFYNTIKEAEQAAARIALMELPISVELFQKDESCPSKGLLMELTQREGFSTPTYKTKESGSSHMPTFFSTVEIEGLEFHGKASRSKKMAENDAAKIAYIALKECGLEMYAAFSSSMKENQAIQSTHKSDIVKSMQILNSEDDKLMDEEILPTDAKINNGIHNESFPLPPKKKFKMSKSSPSSPKSYPFSHTDLPSVPVFESNNAKASDTSNYLLCNGFEVFTSFPETVFSEGITVLPMDDDKWIASCLDFPNDNEDF